MIQATLPPVYVPSLSSLEFNSLHSFYNSTNGPYWTWTNISDLSVPWNFSIPNVDPCTSNWQGLSCTYNLKTFYIQSIVLNHHNLSGSLSDSITNFVKIEVFDLRFNNISGSLPSNLGNLVQLKNLDFSYNQITGSIPSSIKYCQRLQLLALNYNDLEGVLPSELFTLHNLQALSLAGNRFNGEIPEQIGNLTALTQLQLVENRFTGFIPQSIGQLQSLEEIDLSENILTGTIPESLYSCMNLTSVTITDSNITGTISEKISQLTHLLQLALTENFLYGTIPETIGELTQLEALELGTNYLFGTIPSSIVNLQNLHVLFLEYNGFYGNITMIAKSFSKLGALFLHGNLFTGKYPMTLEQFKRLEYIDISENLLSGPIPWYDNTTTNLNIYECFNNYFTGVLPAETSQISYLLYYIIQQNYLTGTIVPNLFSDSKPLYYLDLSYNLFTGSIPSAIGEKTSLNQLVLGGNYLTGPIPASFTEILGLVVLQLNDNQLTGTIPVNLTQIRVLEELFLQNNLLTGCINHFFDSTLSTEHFSGIDFSGNSFTGTLPASFFTTASNLQSFAISTNCLTGSIPDEICSATQLISLSLDGLNSAPNCRNTIFPGIPYFNGFTVDQYIQGTIPTCLFELEMIQTLHLSGNGLMGTIPSTSSKDPSAPLALSGSFQQLSLSHNLLVGTIPDMFQSYRWFDFDLSYNKLSGTLSSNISSFSGSYLSSVSISLEVNRLSGAVPTALLSTQNISILDGNIFQCNQFDTQNSGLPAHDPLYNTYSCGSDSVDNVLYTWIAAAVLIPVLLLFILQLTVKRKTNPQGSNSHYSRSANREGFSLSKMRTLLKDKLSLSKHFQLQEIEKDDSSLSSLATTQLHFIRLSMFFQDIRFVARVLFVYSVLIFVPVYLGLKQYYSSYSNEYTWTLSGMLLSGRVPAIVLFVFLFLFAACFMSLMQHFHLQYRQRLNLLEPQQVEIQAKTGTAKNLSSMQKLDNAAAEKEEVSPSNERISPPTEKFLLPDRGEAIVVYCLLSFINVLVMCSSDFSYVYIVLNASAIVAAFAAFGLAIFRILTNSVLIRVALPFSTRLWRRLRERLSGSSTGSSRLTSFPQNTITNLAYTPRDISFLENLILFNNIIIPGIAIVFILPDCFYNALFATSKVQSTYYYANCGQYRSEENEGHLCRYSHVSIYYTPSFIYTYQCSSKIVMNYVPVYIILFLLSCILIPAMKILLKLVYDHVKEKVIQLQNEKEVEVTAMRTPSKENDEKKLEHKSNDSLFLESSKEFIRWKKIQDILEWLLPLYFKPFHPNAFYEQGSFSSNTSAAAAISSLSSSRVTVSSSVRPLSRTLTPARPQLFSKVELTVQINSFLTILMCFGALFPPLAVIAAISISCFTFYEEGCMAWVLRKTRELGSEYHWYEEELSKEFEGVEKSSKVTVWSTLIVSCSLYGYIIFDTMGDTAGWMNALPLTLVMLFVPGIFFLLISIYSMMLTRKGEGNHDSTTSPTSEQHQQQQSTNCEEMTLDSDQDHSRVSSVEMASYRTPANLGIIITNPMQQSANI